MIRKDDVGKSMSFNEYYQLLEQLVKEGKTTGKNQSEALVNYTRLNFSRMKRIIKTTTVSKEVTSTVECLNDKLIWVVLSESWCGDAAQNIPVLEKIAKVNTNITLRILLADENSEIMDQYLTHGTRSIPKLICFDKNLKELGTWGPRPKYLQNWLYQEKTNPTMETGQLKKLFQAWYTKDGGQSLQREMVILLKSWLNKECFSM